MRADIHSMKTVAPITSAANQRKPGAIEMWPLRIRAARTKPPRTPSHRTGNRSLLRKVTTVPDSQTGDSASLFGTYTEYTRKHTAGRVRRGECGLARQSADLDWRGCRGRRGCAGRDRRGVIVRERSPPGQARGGGAAGPGGRDPPP